MEQPAEFNRLVLDFLSSVRARITSYCAQSMNLTEEGWYCSRGDMYFSPQLAESILSILKDTPVNSKAVIPWEETKPSVFHCPRCQRRMYGMNEASSSIVLGVDFDLPLALIFQLVEFHPHTSLP